MPYECTICPDGEGRISDKRGRRGHVKFTEGGGHGAQGDLPDDWEDKFREVGNGDGGGSDGGAGDGAADGGGDSSSDSGGGSTGSGGLRGLLETDLRELFSR